MAYTAGRPLNALAEPLNPSSADPADVSVAFTPYERHGVIVMAVAGVISCVLVSSLLLYIAASAISPFVFNRQKQGDAFIRRQIAVFVICLLISDLIQSVAGVTQVKWAMQNGISRGPACTIQAGALVMGDLGSTIWSIVIALHTFSRLALNKQWTRTAVISVVVAGWLSIIILTLIGPTALTAPTKGPFFAIAGSWCFITSEYDIARLVIHYIPMFVAALTIFLLYGLLFLVLRGNISFVGGFGRSFQAANASEHTAFGFSQERNSVAKRMLWYPVAYLTCAMPISIIRVVGFTHPDIPEAAWIFAMFFLFFLGACDAVVYTVTRRVIKPIHRHRQSISLRNSGKRTHPDSSLHLQTSDIAFKSSSASLHSMSSPSSMNKPYDEEEEPSSERRYSPPPLHPGAIRITLERIQEVI